MTPYWFSEIAGFLNYFEFLSSKRHSIKNFPKYLNMKFQFTKLKIDFWKVILIFYKVQRCFKVKVIYEDFRSVLECGDKWLQDWMITNEVTLVNHSSGWKGLKSFKWPKFNFIVNLKWSKLGRSVLCAE